MPEGFGLTFAGLFAIEQGAAEAGCPSDSPTPSGYAVVQVRQPVAHLLNAARHLDSDGEAG
jgi:hypothetical protein